MIRLTIYSALIICLLFYTFDNVLAQKVEPKLRLGIISIKSANPEAEISDILNFALELKSYRASIVTAADISKKKSLIKQFDVLWIHYNSDLTENDEFRSKSFISEIMKYVSGGGRLMLTHAAFALVSDFELDYPCEKQSLKANSYCDLLGMPDSPYFNGIGSGARMFDFNANNSVVFGFFDPKKQSKGKIPVVMLNGKNSMRIVTEYNYGHGKICAIGCWNDLNDNYAGNVFFKTFLTNALNALVASSNTVYSEYWSFEDELAMQKSFEVELKPMPQSTTWYRERETLLSHTLSGRNGYWNLSGRNILLQGIESGGITHVRTNAFTAVDSIEPALILKDNDSIVLLSRLNPIIDYRPESIERLYRFSEGNLKEIITFDIGNPLAIVHYEWRGAKTVNLVITYKSSMSLLQPYPKGSAGKIEYSYDDKAHACYLRTPKNSNEVIVSSSLAPSEHFEGMYGRFDLRPRLILPVYANTALFSACLKYEMNPGTNLSLAISASNGGQKADSIFNSNVGDIESLLKRTSDYYRLLLNQNLSIKTPDRRINSAYAWSIIGCDKLFKNIYGLGDVFTTTDESDLWRDNLSGTSAYKSFWGAMATIDYGDFDKARRQLDFYCDKQKDDGGILNSVSKNGFIIPEALNSSSLLVILTGKYVRHSGDVEYARKIASNLDFALENCIDLMYKLESDYQTKTLSIEEYIVHSTFLAAAFDEAVYLNYWLGNGEGCDRFSGYFSSMSANINKLCEDFEAKFADNVFKFGTDFSETAMSLALPMYFGILEEYNTKAILKKLNSIVFGSDWGVYGNPIEQYQSGWQFKPPNTVSPFINGLLSCSNYNYLRPNQGFQSLMYNVFFKNDKSCPLTPELFSGYEYKPITPCLHFLLSEALTYIPIAEGMLGIDCSAPDRSIRLSPSFPADWDSVSVENIKIGNSDISFDYIKDKNALNLVFRSRGYDSIAVDFNLNLPAGMDLYTKNKAPLEKSEADFSANQYGSHLHLAFKLKDTLAFTFEYTGGVEALPQIEPPKPFNYTDSYKVISTAYETGEYSIIVEGKPSTRHVIRVYAHDTQIENSEHYKIESQIGDVWEIGFGFEPSKQAFARKEIKLKLRTISK